MAQNRDEEAYLSRQANMVFSQGQRLSIWEVLGIVSTFRQNVERLKLYKATLSVIRFMAVLNFIYTVVGTAFLIIGLFENVHEAMGITPGQSGQFLKLGKFLKILHCSFCPITMLQKHSKCEVKAAWCGNITILEKL